MKVVANPFLIPNSGIAIISLALRCALVACRKLAEPPINGFSSEGWKDSIENIRDTGEVSWNLVSRDLARDMNLTSQPVPAEVDEFSLAGIRKGECRTICAKRVADSPVAFECQLSDLSQQRSYAANLLDRWLVPGEVIGAHVHKSVLENGVYQTAKARPILRGGGKA
jgi:flavin reductase (DIM6/NTAB) family NADH-FMN oxidoreductase RutF